MGLFSNKDADDKKGNLNEFFEELSKKKNLYEYNNDELEKLFYEYEQFVEEEVLPTILNYDKSMSNDDILHYRLYLYRVIEFQLSNYKSVVYKPWLNNGNIICFIGKFSSGKSSIINSILGTPLLPVAIVPSTAIPTYLTNHFKLSDEIFLAKIHNGEMYKLPIRLLKSITKEQISSYPLDLNMFIEHFVVPIKSRQLENFTIIDTPGFDPSNERYDRIITESALELSRCIFYIIDIEDGDIRTDALEFIKRNIKEEMSFNVIINKCDLKPQRERENVRKQVENTLNNNNIKFNSVMLYSTKSNEYRDTLINYMKKILHNESDLFTFMLSFIDRMSVEVSEERKEIKKLIKDYEDEISSSKRDSPDYSEKFVDIFKKYVNYNEGFFSNSFEIDESDYAKFLDSLAKLFDKIAYQTREDTYKEIKHNYIVNQLQKEMKSIDELLIKIRKVRDKINEFRYKFRNIIVH